MTPILEVQSQYLNYPVFRALPQELLPRLWQKRWQQGVIIGDTTTLELFGAAIEAALAPLTQQRLLLSFAPGESYKTRETKAALEDTMLSHGIERGACVVAVGGGIPLDLGGFVAATYRRGIAHLAVATTLLAQVDASVGGKTGLNTPLGKNAIGAFYPPRAVILHSAALGTLPPAELKNGFAEAIKHGVIADPQLLSSLKACAGAPPHDSLIDRCVEIKAAVVNEDEREQGRREVLNFGHTVGHAIESATKHRLAHGAAVGYGMLVEASIAIERCAFPLAHYHELKESLAALGFALTPPCPFEDAAPFFIADKKTRHGEIRCALPKKLGAMAQDSSGRWSLSVSPEEIRDHWTPI